MANKNRLKQGENGVSDTTTKSTQKAAQTRFDRKEVPTLEQCQQQVREYAYELWEVAGYPEGNGSNFWVEAEKQLFGGMTPQGGYRIYVGDEKNPSPQAFILTATGLEDEKEETEAPATSTNSKSSQKQTATANA